MSYKKYQNDEDKYEMCLPLWWSAWSGGDVNSWWLCTASYTDSHQLLTSPPDHADHHNGKHISYLSSSFWYFL